jgi:hypothetical protein
MPNPVHQASSLKVFLSVRHICQERLQRYLMRLLEVVCSLHRRKCIPSPSADSQVGAVNLRPLAGVL